MMVQEHESGSAEVLERAWRAEMLHFGGVARDGLPDRKRDPSEALDEWVDSCVCSMALATIGAAARYANEHPDDEDPEIRRLGGEAALVVATVSPRLHRLWTMHFVEGQSLAAYAESTGIDATAAQSDYFEIIQTVSWLMHTRHAEKMTASGMRRRATDGAADPTGAVLSQE